MSTEYCRSVLKVSLAQICQNLGWHATQSTPLELLTDILERYMFQLANVTHRYAEQFGRTEPILDDLGLAFHQLDINCQELEEYIRHVEPIPFAHEVISFPAPKQNTLQIPKPQSRELHTRDDHIPDYLPLMFPSLEEETEVDTDVPPEMPEQSVNITDIPTVQEVQHSVDTSPLLIGEKRPLTSPQDGIPKKRARINNALLPEEAQHSQYEMKSIAITHSGDLTPTKGGILPDARTPPQGFNRSTGDRDRSPKPVSSKSVKKEKKDGGHKTPITKSVKQEVDKSNKDTPKSEKDKDKTVEEIIIFPDGTSCSKKIDKKSNTASQKRESETKRGSDYPTPKMTSKLPSHGKIRRKPGRPRSGSKSPGSGSKSPFRSKSPGQAQDSPRKRGRPPKEKTVKSPEKKSETEQSQKKGLSSNTMSTMDALFTREGVLDLSMSGKRKQEEPVTPASPVSEANIKHEIIQEAETPLDLTKTKEDFLRDEPSSLIIAESAPHRSRGRPPLSPEKKRARAANIEACIDAVIKRNQEEMQREEKEHKKDKIFDFDDDIKQEKLSESEVVENDAPRSDTAVGSFKNIPGPSIKEVVQDHIPQVTVKKENLDTLSDSLSSPPQGMSTPVISKKIKKNKTQKNKDKNPEAVKEKLKEKLKSKENELVASEKEETNEQEKVCISPVPGTDEKSVPDVYDFPESPPSLPTKQKELSPVQSQSPVRFFTVDFVDKSKETEKNRDSEKTKEKGKDKERSKEHKKEKKEKKKVKEKKKKNKDKDRDRERKKEKDKNKEPSEFPTVTKLKIKLGSSPSSVLVSNRTENMIVSPKHENMSPKDSPRPELKLVIKALPPLASQDKDSISPSSTPKLKEKERSKKESKEKKEKKEKEKDKEVKRETPPPLLKPEILNEEPPVLTPQPPPRIPTPAPKSPTPEPEHEPEVVPEPEPETEPEPEPETEPEPVPENEPEPESEAELEIEQKQLSPRFTPSPASTRKTFTPSPSNSPFHTFSPSMDDNFPRSRSKSNSQSPVRTPSLTATPSPQASPPPSPTQSPPNSSRSSPSPTPTKVQSPAASPSSYKSPTPSPGPVVAKEESLIPPMPPPSISAPSKSGVQRTVIAETVTLFVDDSGQQIWICPACKRPDDGSNMIGCDICDNWYHWACLGITVAPPEEESWYCSRCLCGKKKPSKRGRGRGRGRGPGRGRKKIL